MLVLCATWNPTVVDPDYFAVEAVSKSSVPILVQAIQSCQSALHPKRIVVATYRTVEHVLSRVASSLDVVFQGARVKRLEQLEAAQKVAGNRHHGTPVVEFSTILRMSAYPLAFLALSSNLHWVPKTR